MKRSLLYVLFLITLTYTTVVNNGGGFFKEGMIYMYLIYGFLTAGFIVVQVLERKDILLTVTAAGYQFMLYLFALFIFLQKMAGGSLTTKKSGVMELGKTAHMQKLGITVLLAAVICVAVFLVFKNMDDRLFHLVGLLAACAIPVMLILTHFSASTNNAHINLFGRLLVSGPVLAMAPFAAAYFLDLKALNDLRCMKFRRGPLALLIWLVICSALAVWNNDLGVVLLMGGAVGLVILSEIKGRHIKYGLVICAMIVLVLVSVLKPSVRARFEQAFSPYHVAYESVPDELWEQLNKDPESLTPDERAKLISAENAQKQLLRNKSLFTNGWYGGGYGSVSLRQNPERGNDYIIQTVGLELGIVFLLALLLMTATFAVCLYISAYSAGVHPFEIAVMKTATWLILIPLFYIPLSNLGILPLTGICYPFLSYGISVFCLGYAVLAGILGGILERNHNRWLSVLA